MTPKEKADELMNKYLDLQIHGLSSINATNRATNCAAICVQEIIDNHSHRKGHTTEEFNYWHDVLNQLNNAK